MLCANTAGAATMDQWFRDRKQWYKWNTTAQKGDVVSFDWTSGQHSYRSHVGIVLADNGDGTITTIEGNTGSSNWSNGGAVCQMTRSKKYVVGYGRPAYASEEERDEFVQLAKEQIGVKEYPANSNKCKYNTWFYGQAVSGSAYPWCAVFVSWIFNSGNAPSQEGEDVTVNVTLKELKSGSEGAQVKTLQRILRCKYDNTLSVDGEFGSRTTKALKIAQAALGVSVDGVCGEQTWVALLTQCL